MSILGLVTYLTRFSAKLAMLTGRLRELNKKAAHFKWELRHQKALDAVKSEQTDASLNGSAK